jgi:hypothetical protein
VTAPFLGLSSSGLTGRFGRRRVMTGCPLSQA